MKKTLFALGFAVMLLIVSSQTNWESTYFSAALSSPSRPGAALPTVPTVPADVPGDGFAVEDDCGFVMGKSAAGATGAGSVDFDGVADNLQGCVDADGYFYKDASQSSKANNSMLGVIDFAWSTTTANNVVVDSETGYWSGSARLPGRPVGPGQWLWFDWTCSGCTDADYAQRVHTDLVTGDIAGYAWSDYLGGYVSFNGLTQELAPMQIVTYVDILSDDGLSPGNVTIDDAPMADGYQYWRARVQFYDLNSLRYLTDDEVDLMEINVVKTAGSKIYLDQTANSGDAILETSANPNVSGCATDTGYCVMTEIDEYGNESTSFNTFVYSGAPTSDMTGMDTDDDAEIEYITDRSGCKWIYPDTWSNPVDPMTRPSCSGAKPDKADVYYDRDSSRNMYVVDQVTIVDFGLTSARDYVMEETYVTFDGNDWVYDPTTDLELSFRPRFQVQNFVAEYDGAEYTTISDDESEHMKLNTTAKIRDLSDEFLTGGGAPSNNRFTIRYQMDVDSDPTEVFPGNTYLLIDGNTPIDDVADNTFRGETPAVGAVSVSYDKKYVMNYGQKESECGTTPCAPPTNTVSNPTAEQWVCDYISESIFASPSCYFTAYLPILDRHVDPPEGMLVSGAINSTIDENDVFDAAEDDISILGAADVVAMRNKMYAQTLRYVLGQTAGSGSLNALMEPTTSSDIVSLMNGRILYAGGDVVIDGSAGFVDKTLVVIGGDVYIHGDVTGGKLGIIAFESGGRGGNVYVYPGVTNIYANIFIDGSLFSYSGSLDGDGVPEWANDVERVSTLLNQLYLKGSLTSRNTVGGSESASCSGGQYPKGDGSCVSDQITAQEYDLKYLRQFRQCYVLDSSGVPTTTIEPCDEGEQLSNYVDPGTGAQIYDASFIIEYDPAGDLPIFVVESGLFR